MTYESRIGVSLKENFCWGLNRSVINLLRFIKSVSNFEVGKYFLWKTGWRPKVSRKSNLVSPGTFEGSGPLRAHWLQLKTNHRQRTMWRPRTRCEVIVALKSPTVIISSTVSKYLWFNMYLKGCLVNFHPYSQDSSVSVESL